MELSANSFVGTWRLLSVEEKLGSGEVRYPFGRDAVGYLTYGQDRYMSVTIMQNNRSRFASADLRAGSAEDKAAAFDGYLSYCGTYRIDEGKMIHEIEMSLLPNWIGSDQERYFEFRGEQLILRAPPMIVGGIEQTRYITWQRVGALPT